MADDRFPARPASTRDWWSWLELFRTFRVALDPRKLVLAAAGILTMALGWWVISVLFYSGWSQPTKDKLQALPTVKQILDDEKDVKTEIQAQARIEELRKARDKEFDESLDRWSQLHYLAGAGESQVDYVNRPSRKVWGGRLRTLPWYEDRGPNPYRLVTAAEKPWEKGDFVGWFLKHEVPILIEPLIKFLEPILHLLNPKTGSYERVYLLLVLVWTLATWALFGGAITRMAAIELAGKEPVTIKQAVKFVLQRYVSYLCGPLVPFGLIAILVVIGILFGLLHLIPFAGDLLVSGLFWPVAILIGLGMALLLVGLVGYPLMYPTISAEGSDTLDALSRSYNYVYQSPWNFLLYSGISILYGAVVIFFVGFMGSLTVYLGKWAVSLPAQTLHPPRNPNYLFIYAPTSFGWRETLLEGSEGAKYTSLQEAELALLRLPDEAKHSAAYQSLLKKVTDEKAEAELAYNEWMQTYYWYNKVGAGMVCFWITLVFLMVLGFGYSFFWTASTMIYLLMRRKVDDTDLDEVYLEQEEVSDPFGPGPSASLPMAPVPAPAPGPAPGSQMVDLNIKTDKPSGNGTPQPPPAPPEPPPAPPEPPPSV